MGHHLVQNSPRDVGRTRPAATAAAALAATPKSRQNARVHVSQHPRKYGKCV